MSLRTKFTALLALAAVIAISLYSLSPKDENQYTSLKSYYSQQLSWSTCYKNFDCADLEVPIDYTDLATGTFQISVLRHKADDQSNRIGSLIVNPGGPGASGVDYAYNAEYIFSPDITDRYDIVGFDPRGVSESEPIKCFTDSEADANFAGDTKPDSDAEIARNIADTKAFIAKCLSKTDHLTAYSTANAARDMDILRAVVGDEKLNYMGKSYGTFMGTLYAQLFPDKIGRVVLDGAVDPTISSYEQTKAQAVSFDGALAAFIEDCAKRSSCPVAKNTKTAEQEILTLLNTASKKPLPLKEDSDRLLTESLMVIGMASSLYDSENGWPALRTAIKEAKEGYGDTFIQLADGYTGRDSDGHYPNNEFDSGAVIDCLDFADTRPVDQIKSDAKKIALAAPIFGPYLAYGALTCKYMPKTVPLVIKQTTTTSPIIIIGTTRDPATPYAWAVGLHSILTNSQLITFDGDGHTGHGRGSACVDDAVDAYYLTGALPKPDLRCS